MRSIAITRAIFGLLCIYDLLLKYNNLHFYVPNEYYPRAYFDLFYQNNPIFLSLFSILDGPWFFKVMIAAGVISSIMIAIGKYTRVNLIILWIIFLSFKNQMHMERKAFDILMLMMFLWFFLMPKDKGLVEAFQKPTFKFFDFSSIGWTMQIVLLYSFTFLYKLPDPAWAQNFSALTYILRKGYSYTYISDILFIHKSIPPFLTFMTLLIEGIIPLSMLVFFRNDKFRMIACMLMILFHCSIFFFLDVGIFTPLSICLWISLLPGIFWERVLKLKDDSVFMANKIFSLRNILAIILMIIVIISNVLLFSLPIHKRYVPVLSALGINQSWAMFSNDYLSASKDHWLVTDSGGFDFLNDRPVTPDYFTKYYPPKSPDYTWRALLWTTKFDSAKRNRLDTSYYLVDYLCRKNNLNSVIKLFVMVRDQDTEKLDSKLLLEYQCRPKNSTGSF